jgi:acetyl/propionyl-CoA carboxylase alpha subunit
MIAKLSVWGRNRDEAVARMRVALDELSIEAPKSPSGELKGSLRTNVTFLQRLVRCADVIAGRTTTDLIPRHPELTRPQEDAETDLDTALALALLRLTEGGEAIESASVETSAAWKLRAKWEALR